MCSPGWMECHLLATDQEVIVQLRKWGSDNVGKGNHRVHSVDTLFSSLIQQCPELNEMRINI